MAWIIKLITKTPNNTPIIKVVYGAKSLKSVEALAVISELKPLGNEIIDNIVFIRLVQRAEHFVQLIEHYRPVTNQ